MFSSVTISDWLTILAILLAPVVAIQVDRYLASIKERRARKLNVFHILMATRGARLAPLHTEALNRIDVEFYGGGVAERDVREAWREYLDHLLTTRTPANEKQWDQSTQEYFTTLLTKMAKALDYHFDPVVLKKGGYHPIGYGEYEQDWITIRKELRELLEGKQALPVTVKQPSSPSLSPPSACT